VIVICFALFSFFNALSGNVTAVYPGMTLTRTRAGPAAVDRP
jgi:hypothetical protein